MPHFQWTYYATGYKDAADLLIDTVAEKHHETDVLVFPIAFLYRQYLELSVKDLLVQARNLLDIDKAFPSHHRIDEIWKECMTLLGEIAPGDSTENLQNVGTLIAEFVGIDPISSAFRYPEDTKGNPSLPDLKHIDLVNMKEVIGGIAVMLDGADALIDEYSSFKDDMI